LRVEEATSHEHVTQYDKVDQRKVGCEIDEGVTRRRERDPCAMDEGRSFPDSCVDAGNLHPRA